MEGYFPDLFNFFLSVFWGESFEHECFCAPGGVFLSPLTPFPYVMRRLVKRCFCQQDRNLPKTVTVGTLYNAAEKNFVPLRWEWHLNCLQCWIEWQKKFPEETRLHTSFLGHLLWHKRRCETQWPECILSRTDFVSFGKWNFGRAGIHVDTLNGWWRNAAELLLEAWPVVVLSLTFRFFLTQVEDLSSVSVWKRRPCVSVFTRRRIFCFVMGSLVGNIAIHLCVVLFKIHSVGCRFIRTVCEKRKLIFQKTLTGLAVCRCAAIDLRGHGELIQSFFCRTSFNKICCLDRNTLKFEHFQETRTQTMIWTCPETSWPGGVCCSRNST